jgi:hypothetical protein
MRATRWRAFLGVGAFFAPAVLAGLVTLGALHAQEGTRALEVDRRKDLDKGASERLDLGALAREYARFKAAFAGVVEKSNASALAMLDDGYDAGLPACRGRGVRGMKLGATLPERFSGQKLAFVAVNGGRLELASAIADDAAAGILVVKTTKLRALGEASSNAGRTLSAGTKELAASVGVKCYPTWVEIKPNRQEVEVHEGE